MDQDKEKVVKIDLFTPNNLPSRLREIAEEQGIILGKDIVVVKTLFSSPRTLPTYEFMSIGAKIKEVQAFMEALAKADGINLNEAVQKAFKDISE